MAKQLMIVQVQDNMSPPAYIQTLYYYGRWYYDTWETDLLPGKKFFVRVRPDITKTKYTSQKIIEIKKISPSLAVKQEQDLRAVVQLGGPFAEIGGDNENAGGGHQKLG